MLKAIRDFFVTMALFGAVIGIIAGGYMIASTAALEPWPIETMGTFVIGAIIGIAGLLGIALSAMRAMDDPARML